MSEDYKATGTQLDWPPEAKGISWDDWIKTRPVATKADVDAFLKRIQARDSRQDRETPQRGVTGEYGVAVA